MKIRILGVVANLACCALGIACVTVASQPTVSQPRVEAVVPSGVEDEPFYDDLAEAGEWVYVSGPGWVWSPYNTPAGWRPYQLGHWVYTDYGWTWASDESYGWAVYHYGRWCNDWAYGWVWVPGTEWGPAWVAWHEGGGWVGWAPLPWQVSWRVGVGLDWGGVNVNVALGPSTWYFVQARDMVSPGLRYRVAPASRNASLIQITQNVTNYIYVDNRIIDRSVKVEKVGRAVGHTIPRYRVRAADSPGSEPGGKVRGQEFVLFRPSPVRGAKSQGRVIPPGHDYEQHSVDRGRHTTRSDEASNTEPGEGSPSDSDSMPPSARTRQRPPRYPRGSEQQPTRTPHQFEGEETPPPDAPLANPAENRPNRPAPGNRRGSSASPGQTYSDRPAPADQGQGATSSGRPESQNASSEKPESATAPSEKRNQGKAQTPASPTQAKPQPAKSKGKNPGNPAAKPDKPKPEEKEKKGSNADESKSEDADSGDRN